MRPGWGEASKSKDMPEAAENPQRLDKHREAHGLTVTLVFLGSSTSETANNLSPLLGAMKVTKALALYCGVLRSQSRDHL